MFLKALTLQGFKTFAQRTHFAFEPGITAIVGPNGSGKSNFADAIRWVLGEQNLRSLRGRRTEDVLFAGGTGRPPAGMAEVTLAFDNSQHWLDVAYDEVTVARRAYRSGENEYYLNRDRVRLRDVADVLGQVSLGADGFAIVGQGTIDAALSLRPEDRRGLIEQAAAISHLYLRLDEAKGRLAATEQNLARLSDLISELAPRLRTLERQARQAREREAVQSEFFRGLIRWYAHLWFDPSARQRQARIESDTCRDELRSAVQALASIECGLEKARAERATIEQTMVAARDRLNAIRAAATALDQASALDRTRQNDLRRQRDEYQTLLDQHNRDLESERIAAKELTARRDALASQLASIELDFTRAEKEAAVWHGRRASLELAVREAHHQQARVEAQHASAQARQRAAQDRLNQLDRTDADHDQRLAALETELAETRGRVEECQSCLQEARTAADRAKAQQRIESERFEASQAEANRLATELAAIDRDLHGLRARHDALQQVESGGSAYFAGVRAVLQAANGHGQVHLGGVVGVVAKLLVVAPEKELAIETALGGHLQDVVVNRWVDAEAAIAYLKRTGAGRATFLPLDTLRPSRRSPPPTGPGLLGVASSLVDVETEFQIVSEYLLGQTLVVEDMGVARRILRDCAPFWQIVTLEGEITRPSGVVTGGAPGQTRGTLARQRELRAGRLAIAAREDERVRLANALAQARTASEVISASLAELSRQTREAEERVRQSSAALAEAQRQSERVLHGLNLRREERERLNESRAGATNTLAQAEQDVAQAVHDQAATAKALADAQAKRAQLERDIGESGALLTAKRSERDTVRERLKAVETALSQAEARVRHLAGQTADRQSRLTRLSTTLDELADAEQRREAERSQLADRLADAQKQLASLDQSYQNALATERKSHAEYQRWQATQREATERLRDAERRGDLATTEIDGLRQQVLLEIGTLDDEALQRSELLVELATGATLSAPIDVAAEPERLRGRLDSLRNRLRTMPVGAEAIVEYEEARERLEFLTGQSADLQRTITALREAIDETRSSMRSRFDDTFASVAAGFTRRFVDLFGGGTARLVVDGDDEDAGIEVIAQPPGKRAESLSMLSGGERALTAAALLFSLIEANPPPFCVLDEVDAALDESNVGRFCAALRTLSERTQFIVITHNRRTMEAATTIYGLAVENRCESRVLSMHLPAL